MNLDILSYLYSGVLEQCLVEMGHRKGVLAQDINNLNKCNTGLVNINIMVIQVGGAWVDKL